MSRREECWARHGHARLASAMSCRFYLNVVIVPLDGWVLVRQPQDPKTWALWMSSRETIIIQQRTLYYPFGWLCSLAFVCRVGVKCIWGFRWRLPARLGLRRAFELSSLQFVLPAACCLPLFVSRPSSLPSPSSSQLAFVVRNLVFIGFLGLNFNLVLARKPDLCTSRCPPYSIHTYVCTYARYARCAANRAIYTRHSLCSALLLSCSELASSANYTVIWGLPPPLLLSLPVPIAI